MYKILSISIVSSILLSACATNQTKLPPIPESISISKKEQQNSKYSLAGLSIGGELSNITECKLKRSILSNKDFDYDYGSNNQDCFRRPYNQIGKGTDISNERIGFDYSYKTRALRPYYIDNAYVQLINNKIEEVFINTDGLNSQETILSDLTNKFGKPTKVNLETGQNGFGAQFKIIQAYWSLNDTVEVVFLGAVSKKTAGIIKMNSLKARELEKKINQEEEKKRPKL